MGEIRALIGGNDFKFAVSDDDIQAINRTSLGHSNDLLRDRIAEGVARGIGWTPPRKPGHDSLGHPMGCSDAKAGESVPNQTVEAFFTEGLDKVKAGIKVFADHLAAAAVTREVVFSNGHVDIVLRGSNNALFGFIDSALFKKPGVLRRRLSGFNGGIEMRMTKKDAA